MQRIAVLVVLSLVTSAAIAAAHPLSSTGSYRRCATIHGPEWSQTINVTANLTPKKKTRLRVIHGRGYYVFVDHLTCAWAGQNVSRLIARGTPLRLHDASPAGYDCRAGRSRWFRDAFNGDAVRRSLPPNSVGACLIEGPDALGLTFRTFWWTPAKPCRSFTTYFCRR
jgi:hypothetical protein